MSQCRYAELAHGKMVSNAITRPEIEDPLITYKSGVEGHFSLVLNYVGDGQRVVDKKTMPSRISPIL